MQINRHDHFSIPKSIVEFVISKKLERAFSVYLCLKMIFGGIVHSSNLCLNTICEILGIKDKRTILKYIKKLIAIGFVGFNKQTCNYFIRGFRFINSIIGGNCKRCLITPFKSIGDIKNLFAAGLIGYRVQGLKLAENRFLKKKIGASALIKRGALQKVRFDFSIRGYFGLSNTQIAELLGYSKSAANRIKIQCDELHYLKVIKRTKLICKLKQSDLNLRKFVPNAERTFIMRNPQGELLLMERLTDEIQPGLFWVKSNKYK